MKLFIPVILILILISTPVCADDIKDGLDAYLQGNYKIALEKWKPLAEEGNDHAQYGLGQMYEMGNGVTKDIQEAFKWYKLSAEQGNAPAKFYLGLMYASGSGVTKDIQEAFKWYKLSAEQGYDEAQSNLGAMYAIGEGVKKDYKKAAKWYRLAAEQGFPLGQYNLGWIYKNGQGVKKDYKRAAKWYGFSAEQGNVLAQLELGKMYSLGEGVNQSNAQAHKWFNISAWNGHKDGHKLRDKLEMLMMTSAQITEAQRLAQEWIGKNERVDTGAESKYIDGVSENKNFIGSPLGYFLLLYGSMVSALSIRIPIYNQSAVQRRGLGNILTILSFPGFIWSLAYVIGHISFLMGFLFWFVSGVGMCLAIQRFGFLSFSGLHLILACPSVVVGTVLTIMTHPF
jgi:TPR repeat protein